MWNSYGQLRGRAVTKILRCFILAIGFTVATWWIDGWPATGICARKTGAKIFPNLNHFLTWSGPKGERLMTKGAQRIAAFGFGVTFVSVLLVLALFVPNPTPFQYTVFRIVLALAAGGVAAMIPGFIQLTISSWVQAGGALAVFLIVFFYSPAALVVT
jgi:hypothetical protein